MSMAALILIFISAFVLAGFSWLLLGSRFNLRAEGADNDIANLAAYFVAYIPITFAVVFFGIGG
jgi:hypothetical protein